ncbi:MAG: ABC transporter ATP-binding protein [Hyphomicrobiales bacterium]
MGAGDATVAVEALGVAFRQGRRTIMAVNEVSFAVRPGETFGLVGESGSGKSTVLRAIAGLLPLAQGTIRIAGRAAGRRRTKAERRLMQLVFQDPYSSLHPRQTVDRILTEPLAIHGLGEAGRRIEEALAEVGLDRHHRFRYPHQLSGGQRQRVAIARALILSPRILLLDEPTSSLDVSIQAEILNLLAKLRRSHGLTSILVSHALAVVAHLCQRVAVMQNGCLVETLAVEDLRRGATREAYTSELIQASRGYRRATSHIAGEMSGAALDSRHAPL